MKRFTHHQDGKEQELERRLQAVGIPIVEPTKNDPPELLIRQNFEAYESTVFDVNGGAGLILPLKIVPNIPLFVFSGIDIFLDAWPGACFRPLEENFGGQWPHYHFYGRSEFMFHHSQTINRVMQQQKEVRCGHPVHGLLLALSYDPMPDDIVRGAVLRGSIKVLDQFEREHSAKISLHVQREVERPLKPSSPRRRLLASPDFK